MLGARWTASSGPARRPSSRPGPGGQAQLSQDVVDVGLDRALGDDEPGRDVLVAQSLGRAARRPRVRAGSARRRLPARWVPGTRWSGLHAASSSSPSASATAWSKEYDAPSANACSNRSDSNTPEPAASAARRWTAGRRRCRRSSRRPWRRSCARRPGRHPAAAPPARPARRTTAHQDSAWTPKLMPVRSCIGRNSRTDLPQRLRRLVEVAGPPLRDADRPEGVGRGRLRAVVLRQRQGQPAELVCPRVVEEEGARGEQDQRVELAERVRRAPGTPGGPAPAASMAPGMSPW